MSILINEIFHSIQGESLWTGMPCVFVRLSDCNLRCRYCDTQYAYEPGQPMALDDIAAQVKLFNCPRLTITGGEPLLQEEAPNLVARLLADGYAVSMETNGSLDIGRVDRRCMKVVDLKCPSSGMQQHNRMENISLLGPEDQIKFVIADIDDFEFAAAMTQQYLSGLAPGRILFSPVYSVLPAERLTAWILASQLDARLQIQLHKIIWPDKDRGV